MWIYQLFLRNLFEPVGVKKVESHASSTIAKSSKIMKSAYMGGRLVDPLLELENDQKMKISKYLPKSLKLVQIALETITDTNKPYLSGFGTFQELLFRSSKSQFLDSSRLIDWHACIRLFREISAKCHIVAPCKLIKRRVRSN